MITRTPMNTLETTDWSASFVLNAHQLDRNEDSMDICNKCDGAGYLKEDGVHWIRCYSCNGIGEV